MFCATNTQVLDVETFAIVLEQDWSPSISFVTLQATLLMV